MNNTAPTAQKNGANYNIVMPGLGMPVTPQIPVGINPHPHGYGVAPMGMNPQGYGMPVLGYGGPVNQPAFAPVNVGYRPNPSFVNTNGYVNATYQQKSYQQTSSFM